MSSSLQTSAAIVSFVEKHLQDIINGSSNQADFNRTFNALFAENVKVIVNGESISRAQFGKQFQDEHNFASSLKVNFIAITVATDVKAHGSQNAAAVGLFYTVDLFSKFLVFGAPEVRTLHVSLNLILDTKEHKVVEVNEVSATTMAPIRPPGPTHPGHTLP